MSPKVSSSFSHLICFYLLNPRALSSYLCVVPFFILPCQFHDFTSALLIPAFSEWAFLSSLLTEKLSLAADVVVYGEELLGRTLPQRRRQWEMWFCGSDQACCFTVQDRGLLSGFDGDVVSISLPQQVLESISSFPLHLLYFLLFSMSSSYTSVSLSSIFHLFTFLFCLCFDILSFSILSCCHTPPSILLISVHTLVHFNK